MTGLLHLLAKEAVDVATLERIYADSRQSTAFATAALFALCQLDSELAWRALWLLRRSIRDQPLDDKILRQIADCADGQTHWIARLNLCQLFSATGCPPSVRDVLYPFLTECFADRRVIIRAWAISALSTFAADPPYRPKIAALLRQARQDPARSMQARLRQIAGHTLDHQFR